MSDQRPKDGPDSGKQRGRILVPHRAIVAACAVLLLMCATVWSEEPAPQAEPMPGGDSLSLDEYYGDSLSHIGSFPGTLICVSSERRFVPENATQCGPDKVYALAVDRPEATVALIGAAHKAADQFALLLGKRVIVRGKHYPDKGMIAVGTIELASTAADAPSQPAAHHPGE